LTHAIASRKNAFPGAIYLDYGNFEIFFGVRLLTPYITPSHYLNIWRMFNSKSSYPIDECIMFPMLF